MSLSDDAAIRAAADTDCMRKILAELDDVPQDSNDLVAFLKTHSMVLQSSRPTHPTPLELAEDGGEYYTRPSDGKLLEYFRHNVSSQVQKVLLVLHGPMQTGHGMRQTAVEHLSDFFAEHGTVQMVCPSFPGFGASSPYTDDIPSNCLNRYSNDLLALLKELCATELYVVGFAFGGEPAYHLAQMALESGVDVKGVAGICASPWSTKSFSFYDTDSMTVTERGRFYAFTDAVTGPILAHYLVIPQLIDGSDMERSARWHIQSVVLAKSLMMQQTTSTSNTDFSAFFDTPFFVCHGHQDTSHARGTQLLLDAVFGARSIVFDGSHEEAMPKALRSVVTTLVQDFDSGGTIYISNNAKAIKY